MHSLKCVTQEKYLSELLDLNVSNGTFESHPLVSLVQGDQTTDYLTVLQ